MKKRVAILIGDGMGDYPLPEFGGKTVLQAARMPNTRRLAAIGRRRRIRTVPPGMNPGSDVANLSLFGYDPAENYTGRAPIEAAGAGVVLGPEDIAFRCNLVTIADGRMADYSAGHITTEEARELLRALEERLGREGLRFHAGVSYRHLLVWRHGPAETRLAPPHDITGRPVAAHAPAGARAAEVAALMEASRAVLRDHPVNVRRVAAGRAPATQIWLWGQGKRMTLRPFQELYGRAGGVISAVDLVRGIGRLAGLEAPRIAGATGFLDTNCEGKVAAALEFLRRDGFAYLHYEAPDECGHLGDPRLKREACEMFDARIVAPVWLALEADGIPYRIAIAPDHFTPCSVRTHTSEPVPLLWADGPTGLSSGEAPYDETDDGTEAQAAWSAIRALL